MRQVFKQLRNVDSERIAICVNGIVNKERKHVRIGPMAWNAVVPTLARFEVLDIFIEPVGDSQPSDSGEKSVGGASAGGLPDYEDVVDGTETVHRGCFRPCLQADSPLLSQKQSFIHRAMKAFGKA